jgi:hypothetical protein
VLRNQDLTPAQKIVAIVTINDAGWRSSVDQMPPYRVSPARLADAAGVKPHTVSSALKVLSAEGGIFSKRVTRDFLPDVGWTCALYLTPRHGSDMLELLHAAASYAPERAPALRKPEPHCPEHPTANVHHRCTSACMVCGQVISERVAVLKCKKPISEVATPSSLVRLKEDVFPISAPCWRCGRTWDVHGEADSFGICAERGPPF